MNQVLARRRVRRTLAALAAVVALGITAAVAAASTIDTTGSWNGTDYVFDWGCSSTPTYGQTILGNGETLASFTFYFDIPSDEAFFPAIYTWNNTTSTVGAKVWQGSVQTLPGSGMRPVTFTPGVELSGGQAYVLFATTQGVSNSSCADGHWGAVDASAYSDGQYVYANGSYLGTWDGDKNDGYASSYDLAMRLDFGTKCWNALGDNGCAQLPRIGVCDAQGRFLDVGIAEKDAAKDGSPLFGATPAAYVQGYGLMCSLTDLVTYGGDPSAYKDAGYRVDNTGTRAPAEMSDADFGAFYEYFAKA